MGTTVFTPGFPSAPIGNAKDGQKKDECAPLIQSIHAQNLLPGCFKRLFRQ